MTKLRIFISSELKEFSSERMVLRDYLRSDVLMRHFFDPFLLEDILNLAEVEHCDIYLGLFDREYGDEDSAGLSSVEREFNLASSQHKSRLIFIKEGESDSRHPKIQKLIQRAEGELIPKRFMTGEELLAAVYAALIKTLELRKLLSVTPFDAAVCPDATLDDLDEEAISRFVRNARRSRGFPLQEEASFVDILTHLNLLNNGRLTHAALLLFGKRPQQFLISSEVKCAHFHGTQIAKPIPSYQVYKGRVFELVDQAVDFVLSKIDLAIGARTDSTEVPVAYEVPPEAVREAIVNAVAHRDYTSNGSVQVMLFADRLEVWNPGSLPPSLTLQQLRKPHGSVLPNPLLAESLYLAKYIERMGTGTGEIISLCRNADLPEPSFTLADGFVVTIWRKPYSNAGYRVIDVTNLAGEVKSKATRQVTSEDTGQEAGEVSGQVSSEGIGEVSSEVRRLLSVVRGEMKRSEIKHLLGLRSDDNFRHTYLVPALKARLIEMTVPDKPNSRLQKYRITIKGRELLA